MAFQNRVDPYGIIHARSERGRYMGNRGGCFHRADRSLKPTRWASRQWIYCLLEFKERQRAIMQPGRYTELFFLDEATALAAGHRPCFECQREKARAFKQALEASGQIAAGSRVAEIDRLIAGEIQARLRRQTEPECVSFAQLPDGAMFDRDGKPFVKWSGLARRWSFAGYGPPRVMDGMVGRLTPVATLNALREGFRVDAIEPS
tara:strand:- start:1601 stop:2215 length:615 start_codon:yes stop_codon:yes gene_type:complete